MAPRAQSGTEQADQLLLTNGTSSSAEMAALGVKVEGASDAGECSKTPSKDGLEQQTLQVRGSDQAETNIKHTR